MDQNTPYTIGELAEAAGVTPRTIRYYTAEGLLPRPDSRGQYALYGEEHLLRLLLIARLKEAYLPLGEIKARLDQLDPGQLRSLLEEHVGAPARAAASAADYIAQILHQPPQIVAETAARYGGAPEPADVARLEAPRALPHGAPAPPAPAAPPYGFAAALPAQPQEPLAASAGAAPRPGLLRRLVAQRREPAPTVEPLDAEEHWRRVALAPGVELHIRESAAPGARERVERLVEFAKNLFKESGD